MARSGRCRGADVLLLMTGVVLLAAPAKAVTLSFEFAGTVDVLMADLGLFGQGIQVGDPFTGHFSYEVGRGNPDQEIDPSIGIYDVLSLVIDQSVVVLTPLVIAIVREAPVITLPPLPPDPGSDRLTIVAQAPGYDSFVRLQLEAPFGLFSDDSLPTSLDLADLTLQANVHGLVAVGLPPVPSSEDIGGLILLIPEPSAVLLLGVALAAVARARRASN